MEEKKEMVCSIDVNYVKQRIAQLEQTSAVQELLYLKQAEANATEVQSEKKDEAE